MYSCQLLVKCLDFTVMCIYVDIQNICGNGPEYFVTFWKYIATHYKTETTHKKRREQWCVCVWAGGWVDGWVEGWIMHISCNFLWISSSFYCSGMKWNQHLSAKKRKRKEKHNSICLSSSCHCPVHTQSAIFDQTYVHRTCETTGNKQALQKQCYVKPRCVIKPTIRLR